MRAFWHSPSNPVGIDRAVPSHQALTLEDVRKSPEPIGALQLRRPLIERLEPWLRQLPHLSLPAQFGSIDRSKSLALFGQFCFHLVPQSQLSQPPDKRSNASFDAARRAVADSRQFPVAIDLRRGNVKIPSWMLLVLWPVEVETGFGVPRLRKPAN